MHNSLMKFTLTEQHIKLLRRMYVSWDDCEAGAPAIDPKRPYGNSDVAGDMAEILGVDLGRDEDGEGGEEMEDKMLALHAETEYALQVVLSTGCFEPGEYRQVERYNTQEWVKA